MKELGVMDAVSELIRRNPAVASALYHRLSDADVALMFDALDLGMMAKVPVDFLPSRNQNRLREIVFSLLPEKARILYDALRRPPVNNMAIIEEFNLAPKDRGIINQVARDVILDDPNLVFNGGLQDLVVDRLWKIRRASNSRRIHTVGREARIKQAIDKNEPFQVIDFVRGYKQISGVRRIPIARATDSKTKESVILVGNDQIDAYDARIKGKEYLSDQEMYKLFSSEVVIEEKVDGHPVVILYGGYTFFCESLSIKHTVSYDNVPYSQDGWPDMTVVYEIMDGEEPPPYTMGQGKGRWLSRSEKENVCSMVGAPLVPLVFKGKVSPERLPSLADRLSSFGSTSAEGIVVKNLQAGVFGKFINLEFQRAISDESLWGGVHPEVARIKNVRRTTRG